MQDYPVYFIREECFHLVNERIEMVFHGKLLKSSYLEDNGALARLFRVDGRADPDAVEFIFSGDEKYKERFLEKLNEGRLFSITSDKNRFQCPLCKTTQT